jgi:hypothetical protein
MVTEADIRLADGRNLHAYDTRENGIAGDPGSAVAVFWCPRLLIRSLGLRFQRMASV